MYKEHCPHCDKKQNVDNRPTEFDDEDNAGEPVICLECRNPVYAH